MTSDSFRKTLLLLFACGMMAYGCYQLFRADQAAQGSLESSISDLLQGRINTASAGIFVISVGSFLALAAIFRLPSLLGRSNQMNTARLGSAVGATDAEQVTSAATVQRSWLVRDGNWRYVGLIITLNGLTALVLIVGCLTPGKVAPIVIGAFFAPLVLWILWLARMIFVVVVSAWEGSSVTRNLESASGLLEERYKNL
jgi:uncharacterized membrane protein